LEEPAETARELTSQIELAEKLRTKHHWSRLLTAIGQATPERVVISSIETSPPQWNPSARAYPVQSSGNAKARIDLPPVLTGVVIKGHAADHPDLSAFMAEVHASGLFRAMDLKEARRDKLQITLGGRANPAE